MKKSVRMEKTKSQRKRKFGVLAEAETATGSTSLADVGQAAIRHHWGHHLLMLNPIPLRKHQTLVHNHSGILIVNLLSEKWWKWRNRIWNWCSIFRCSNSLIGQILDWYPPSQRSPRTRTMVKHFATSRNFKRCFASGIEKDFCVRYVDQFCCKTT